MELSKDDRCDRFVEEHLEEEMSGEDHKRRWCL